MLFNSLLFLVFFPAAVFLYFVFPKKLKNHLLLAASYIFYMGWNPKYAFLILFCTVVTFISSQLIEKIKNGGTELSKIKFILAVSIALILCVLFYFKYLNFLCSLINKVFPILHFDFKIKKFDIILPVGISFFSFQAIGYLIDVYRDEIKAEKNFFKYALFISFFPQLVAGPIERSKNLLIQFEKTNSFDFDRAKDGVLIMIWGYFLKMVLSDRAAIFVNTAFKNLPDVEGFSLIFASVLFAFQIYGDFCGYSLIAKGAAKVLGYNLMDNFKSPYCALNVQDFWRRWHISLSTWFRDYVYFPLGGSRCSKIRTYLNVLIVMALSGLWHGAGTHFIIWGLFHGILQVWDRITIKIQEKIPKLLRIIATFICIDFGWFLFRVPSLKVALKAVKSTVESIITHKVFTQPYMGLNAVELKLLFFCIIFVLLVDWLKDKGFSVREWILKKNAFVQILSFALSIIFILAVGVWGGETNETGFIYFQF